MGNAEFQIVNKDVIVIGAGCAGLTAALEARRQNAQVLLLDKGPIGIGTNSVLSNGFFAGPTADYSVDDYVRDTLQTGKAINYESMVSLVAREAPSAFLFLRSLGIDLAEVRGGYRVKSPRPDYSPGLVLVQALMKGIKKLSGIDLLPGFYVIEILKDDEKVYGVRGIDKSGREVSIYAPAIVLATGGAGAIYLRNDNQKCIMGQGYYLAAKAGLRLWDMEFVQFYPFVIAEPGLPSLLLYPPYPKQVLLINSAGEDIVKKYGINLQEVISTKRDEFSAILFRENIKGPVYMDYRKVPPGLWERTPLNLLRKVKFDFQRKPIAVAPAAHFFMGGVRINENGQTSLSGLFACGEVVWGFHGANRMSGNALTECVVFGRIAGRSAAQYALTHRVRPLNRRSSKSSHRLVSTKGALRELKRQIKHIAWQYAGVVRREEELKNGLTKIMDLERQLNGTVVQTVADRKLKEDLMGAAFVLKAVFTASLSRKESRGSFIREDFPQKDDINWRKNSCLAYDWEEGKFSVSYRAVP
ncbi:hypothetical protein DRQ15_05890 [candidate division KSB1 bacterium]|nr:MAG: hypothetical protein DRQ15_05890 [candidate division KSB1 bacterium]